MWRRISVTPITATSSARTTCCWCWRAICGPPSPVNVAAGRRLRIAEMSCAPYASPEASPAEIKMRGLDAAAMRKVYPLDRTELALRWSQMARRGAGKARRFEAVLEKGDNGLGWTVARVPFVPHKIWPEMLRLRVRGNGQRVCLSHLAVSVHGRRRVLPAGEPRDAARRASAAGRPRRVLVGA